ncbi:MAG TPA: dienelactone hydrolase family protein [Candidatus Polarisedimenticolia bacterium]|nr:dienelactone hydrolase family protein [Candidatus Polarisedimenticolia bacterium]
MEPVRGPLRTVKLLMLWAAAGILLGAVTASVSPGVVMQSAAFLADARPVAQDSAIPAEPPAPTRTGLNDGLSQIRTEHHQFGCYIQKPTTEGTFPGLVVIHDAMGLTNEFKSVVDKFVAEGFAVYAPDLYKGRIALDADKGREMSVLLDEEEAISLLQELVARVKFATEVGDHRVGVVGFGTGGRLALLTGVGCTDLSSVVVAYGRPIDDAATLRRIPCPILGLYGDRDEIIPVATVEKMRGALAAAARTYEVAIYKDAGQGFMNHTDHRYAPEPAKEAWGKMVGFLKGNL